MEPGGEDVWRIEMHDRTGRTLSPKASKNPAADALMPDECSACSGFELRLSPAGDDVRATCTECTHTWLTGHLNDNN